jgi:hypothetical protein
VPLPFLLFLILNKSRDVFFIKFKLIIVAVLPAGPPDLSPEGIAHIIFGKGDQRHPVDPVPAKGIHTVTHHAASDSLPAVFFGNAYMIQAALPAVAPAQDRTHDLFTADCHNTGGGISF